MEHSLKLFLPKLLSITLLVALQPLHAQSVNNPYATYSTILNNPLYPPSHPNFSLLSTVPLLIGSQSVPLTEIEINPVIERPIIPLTDAQFNQWGEADLILQGRYPEKTLPPSPEFSMVFPLFQEVDRLLLTQLNARRSDFYGKQTAYSLGFGQRFWPLDQHHWWGTHLFYDHCPQGKYHRLGLVGEWQNSHARCTVNGYFPLSQWRLDKQDQLEKRPARSLDFRLQWFLFQKPCVNLNMLIEHAFSHSLTYPNQSAAAPYSTALTLGLNYTPVSLVTIGYDAKMAHKEKPSHRLQIKFTYRLGIPLAQQFNPALATIDYEPATNHLSLIHRQSIMLLEQREIPQPATPPVPPTSNEPTEQKPSESTPQAEDRDAFEGEVSTEQQDSINTAADLDQQGASHSDNSPKLDTPPPATSARETEQGSPGSTPRSKVSNVFEEEVSTEQQDPINTAADLNQQGASLSGNSPKPNTPPPATSASGTEQKSSKSTPQTKQHDENLNGPEEEAAAVRQQPADQFGQQKSNDTAANLDHQPANLSDDIQNPGSYSVPSPLTTPEGREPLEQNEMLPPATLQAPLTSQETNTSCLDSKGPYSNTDPGSRINTPNNPHNNFSPSKSKPFSDSSKDEKPIEQQQKPKPPRFKLPSLLDRSSSTSSDPYQSRKCSGFSNDSENNLPSDRPKPEEKTNKQSRKAK